MAISKHFIALGAPFRNIVWSWGAVRNNGDIVLRTAEVDFVAGGLWLYAPADSERHGGRERLEHVRAIEAGATCYVVVYQKGRKKNGDEVIKTYDDQQLWIGKEIDWRDGNAYLKLLRQVPVSNLIPRT